MGHVIDSTPHFQDMDAMMTIVPNDQPHISGMTSYNVSQLMPTIDNAFPCMWNQCTQAFPSLEALASHVNLAHLHQMAPESGFPLQHSSISGCHWDNCSTFPSIDSIPGPSKGDSISSMLGILTEHLMHDHLGFPSRSSSTTFDSSSSVSGDEIQKREPSHDLMDTLYPGTTAVDYSQPSSKRSNMIESDIHLCRWEGCAAIFSSQAELSAHLSEAHVGSGKARYDCHWDQCERFGEKGFTSKQKILRHLQVRLLMLN
jgi:hypothetical protein